METRIASPHGLTWQQIPYGAAMLARAFHDDPFIAHLIPDPERRARLLPRAMACVLRLGLRYGEVHVPSPDLGGIAVWLPPESCEPTLWIMFRAGLYWLPFTIGFGFVRRFLVYQEHAMAMRKKHMPPRHWYLQMLGVDPGRQGRGYARTLLAGMLERFDEERAPCCLDTENGKNLAFYEQFGFRVAEAVRLPGSDVDCWLMTRNG